MTLPNNKKESGVRELLESLAQEIDSDKTVNYCFTDNQTTLLKQYDLVGRSKHLAIYKDFIESYATLTNEYRKKISSNSKKTFLNFSSLDAGRVVWNGLAFGILGSSSDCHSDELAIGLGVTGALATVYSESIRPKISLEGTWWGTVIGSFVGSLFNPESSCIAGYLGGGIGASVGFIANDYASFKTERNSRREAEEKKKQDVESTYRINRSELFQTTLNQLYPKGKIV